MDFSKAVSGCDLYPKLPVILEYGTAGFRAKADLLDHVAFRVGVLAHLRSCATRKVIGLMITASHNPEEDNGIKLIDPDGGMLDFSWESLATGLVNSVKNEFEDKIITIVTGNNVDKSSQGTVLLGWDSRPSSEKLVQIASQGISCLGGRAIKTSLCATPVLHYLVKCKNDPSYGLADGDGYFKKLLTAFDKLWEKHACEGSNYEAQVNFDGANGVGTLSMQMAHSKLKDKIVVNLFNDQIGVPGKLNYKCGADYVKQFQTFPDNLPAEANVKYVSFDGDADRILYYYVDDSKKFHLVDGDRMATLIAMYLKELINEAGINVSFGIVQTAYANGSSTKYINEELRIDVSCVKTGVKYLHPKALEYDIGIYFEANGHGTAVFSSKLKQMLHDGISWASGTRLTALVTLRTFIDMVNETIGDAFSDFLIIETILHTKGWNLSNWEALYDNLPYQQSKVTIKNRNVITTTDAERKVLTPSGLQNKIDELVSRYQSGRAFVRPSGTEDIVRVYAEAATKAQADDLATKVSQLVFDMADGIGSRP